MAFKELFKIETISASDQNSNIPFLRNERNKNKSWRPKVDVGDILKVVGCKTLTKITQTKMKSQVSSDSVWVKYCQWKNTLRKFTYISLYGFL